MTNSKENKSTIIENKTKDIFLKRIEKLDAREQELLLKLYNIIIKDIKK